MNSFKLRSDFVPCGDQALAIEALTEGVRKRKKNQVLLGVTGSGKTFTMANVIEKINRPTLVIVHNKTLAAQLYSEFKTFFPENAVHYFVSYYDYYQPEAYIPQSDTYIAKDASINDAIDRMRHAATSGLFDRNDIIIVASVSCIYGLGSPEAYHGLLLYLEKGMRIKREAILKKLVETRYERNDYDLHRGTFRARGDVVEIFPAGSDTRSFRIELFGDEVEAISEIDPLTGDLLARLPKIAIYPNSHYVIPPDRMDTALRGIEEELEERIQYLEKTGRLLEAQRIEQRTRFDLEMIRAVGYCHGIENYSRHLSGRKLGEAPPTLIDYFPKDFLLFIDESHATIPQLNAMYEGDRSRKVSLIEYGFRLPSAFDNRPLTFAEFEGHIQEAIYVSATPGPYELGNTQGRVVEQIIRPTGLMDPEITVKPAKGQVDDLLLEIKKHVGRGNRVLVTTLTKRMAEDLCEYYHEIGLRVRYLHSEIQTLERTEIIRDLRAGKFDVLVGINLLREGLDLPEVSLVAILDADKEGYLRSHRALIQTMGRAARNVAGEAILYGDRTTDSMQKAVEETRRRRTLQEKYNLENGITPVTIKKEIPQALYEISEADYATGPMAAEEESAYADLTPEEVPKVIARLDKEMKAAAKDLDFERAAEVRDRIARVKERHLGLKAGGTMWRTASGPLHHPRSRD